MHRINTVVVATFMVLLICACAPRPAGAQNPVPLPTDANLAAYMSVTGRYRNVGNSRRVLTMAAWLSAYKTGEQIDFADMTDRAFLRLGLPKDERWGYMAPLDDRVTVRVRITDSRKRLARVKVRGHGTGVVVADLRPGTAHRVISGSFRCDPRKTEYVLTVIGTSGRTLATLAADLGKVSTVCPFVLRGSFDPYAPEPPRCSHYPAAGEHTGTLGDPMEAPGGRSSSSPSVGSATSTGCAHEPPNDSPTAAILRPPPAWRSYIRRRVIWDTVRSTAFERVDYSLAGMWLKSSLAEVRATDQAPALANLSVPPYSESCGRWDVVFLGMATAVLVVPFERTRLGADVRPLSEAMMGKPVSGHGFLSALLKAAGVAYLADRKRNKSGFQVGDLMVWGDVYAVVCWEAAKHMPRLACITTPVTFTLAPNIAPPAGMNAIGSGSITDVTAWTTPAPPGGSFNLDLSFSPSSATVIKALPKGYKYKANGNITFPVGYQGGTHDYFFVPGDAAVTIPCTLTKLLTWRIVTVTQSPSPPLPPAPEGAAYVVVKSAAGVPVRDGYSAFVNGHYVCTFLTLEPGAYTVEATRTMVGAPPATYKGSVTVPLSIGAEREDTVTLTRQ
ncbi:MAG: hypothetical protein NT029_18055 [Armatimonadetes bacterium]|nr:hypothetical protein [Armatimonadota bacterium]